MGMVVVLILGLTGALRPSVAAIDIALLLILGVACQAIAWFWKPEA